MMSFSSLFLLGLLCQGDGIEEKQTVVFVRGMSTTRTSINVYFCGHLGRGILELNELGVATLSSERALSVACGLKENEMTEIKVGRVGDVFAITSDREACVPGRAVRKPSSVKAWWTHDRSDSAHVVVFDDGDVGGVWVSEEEETVDLMWREGLRLLFGSTEESLEATFETSRKARRILGALDALGDENAGALLDLSERVGIIDGNGALLKRRRMSWLADLALGRQQREKCETALFRLFGMLERVARPGIGSPPDALAKPRHANGHPNELLIDHWVVADGYRKLAQGHLLGEPSFDDGWRFELARRGDAEIAVELADDLMEGFSLDADRYPSVHAAAAEMYQIAGDPESRALLADMLLGGFEGIDADPERALELVSTPDASAYGLQVKAHVLSEIRKDRLAARDAFEEAVAAGSSDAKVSLGRILLQGGDAERAKRLLRSAIDDDASLTATLLLARNLWHNDPTTSKACQEARRLILDTVQHISWDMETGNSTHFGMQAAAAKSAAVWDLPGTAASANRCREEPRRNASFLSELNDVCVDAPSAIARSIGAYRMFAVLGAAGISAAQVNAGFVAQRLEKYRDEFKGVAMRHYESVVDDTTTRGDDDSVMVKQRALLQAEANRALGRLDRAKDMGSEWAAFDLSVRAARRGRMARARRLARECAHSNDWPHTLPCDLLTFALQIWHVLEKYVFSMLSSWFTWPPDTSENQRHDLQVEVAADWRRRRSLETANVDDSEDL